MRILIVGAGMGGLTLAALLRQRGVEPVVIDRAPDFDHAGYMLGLYPLGSRVLHGLNAFQRFHDMSEPMDRYAVANGRGETIHAYDMDAISSKLGEIRLISRGELLDVLHEAAGRPDVRMGTSIEAIEDRGGDVVAGLSDGSEATYDLVIGADGIHSKTRDLVFGPSDIYDVAWGGWVWWADKALVPHDLVTEYWGAGRFLGVYPTKERIGVIAAGPVGTMDPEHTPGRRARILESFAALEGRAGDIINSLPADDEELFFWRLSDQRTRMWIKGRVALMGDSACAFLPTAGIGASMAMESAAVMADELSRTDAAMLGHALDFYEKRRKARVEAAQADSRSLAKMMFVESTPLAWSRDQLLKFYTLEQLAKSIAKIFDQPI